MPAHGRRSLWSWSPGAGQDDLHILHRHALVWPTRPVPMIARSSSATSGHTPLVHFPMSTTLCRALPFTARKLATFFTRSFPRRRRTPCSLEQRKPSPKTSRTFHPSPYTERVVSKAPLLRRLLRRRSLSTVPSHPRPGSRSRPSWSYLSQLGKSP